MVQFLPIAPLQYPSNAQLDFSPVANALTNYQQATNQAEQWPYRRNALLLENELQRARLEGMPDERELRRAQTEQIRQAIAASRTQQELRAGIMGQINGLMGGQETPPTPPPVAPAPVSPPPSALGPVTPRTVRLLPVDPALDSVPLPQSSVRPAVTASPAPVQLSGNREIAAGQPRGVPTAPPRVPLGGYGTPTPFQAQAQGSSAATETPTGPVAADPRSVQTWITGTPIRQRPALPSAEQLSQGIQQLGPPLGAAQVRGWLGTGEEPDFQGTPIARGVAPSAAAPPQVAPTSPAPPAAQVAPPQAPPQVQAPTVLGMPLDRARRLAVLLDAAGMRNEFLEKEIANSGAAAQAGERSRAEAIGKAQGEAQNNLPQAMQSTASMVSNIDAIINDPNLGYITGWQQFGPLRWLPYSPGGQDTSERIRQVIGQSFLQAYQGLRGGGQITEAEGSKAQAAIGRLENLAQSDAGYLQALNDARFEVWDLMNLARRRAGQAPIPYVPHATDRNRLQRIASDEDWAKLPSGMPYIDPEGNVKVKR